jgi:hypothetical protein
VAVFEGIRAQPQALQVQIDRVVEVVGAGDLFGAGEKGPGLV